MIKACKIDCDTKKKRGVESEGNHTPFQCQATVGCLDFLQAGIVLEPESFVSGTHGLLAVTPIIRSMPLCEEKPGGHSCTRDAHGGRPLHFAPTRTNNSQFFWQSDTLQLRAISTFKSSRNSNQGLACIWKAWYQNFERTRCWTGNIIGYPKPMLDWCIVECMTVWLININIDVK